MKSYELIWTKKAFDNLDSIFSYVFNTTNSKTIANKVINGIISKSQELKHLPNKYQKDEFILDQDLNIRRCFIWHYRIIFEVLENQIVILSIQHTNQNPQNFSIV